MNIKKTIIAAVVGLTLVALVAPGVAQGVTIEELLAQIAVLQAQLLALQGGTPVSGTVPAACAGVTFTRALTVGSTGADVRCLQATLNAQGFTVAAAGAGSPGSETTFFGPLTLTAVRAFQVAKGWVPANQVGPLTRAALNSAIAGGVTPTTPTTPGVTTPGVEGSIVVTKSVSPISGAELNVGQAGVPVYGVDVKVTGSDVVVNRLDLLFDGAGAGTVTGTGCNMRPWTYISGVTVSDGSTSKSIAVTSANTIENTVGSSYTVRLEGLGMLVSKDTTKKLTVNFDAVSALPSGATTCATTVLVTTNGVRATDGAGVSQYNSSPLARNNFTVKTGDTGTLTVSASSDNPKARNVIIQETAQTDNIVLLKFNVEAKNNDVIVRTVQVNAVSSSGTLSTVLPVLKLLDGGTELAATSTTAALAGSSTFESLNITIPKNTIKTFTIVGSIAKTNTSIVTEGTFVRLDLDATDITAEDATTYASANPTSGTVVGTNAYVYLKAPTFAFVSKSIVPITPTSGSTTQAANATLAFNVTANGGDIYIAKMAGTAASSGIVASTTDIGASATVTYSFTSDATEGTNAWKVFSGGTKTFTVTGVVAETDTDASTYYVGYFAGMQVGDVKWDTADANATDPTNIQTWGLDDLKTDQIYLNPVR